MARSGLSARLGLLQFGRCRGIWIFDTVDQRHGIETAADQSDAAHIHGLLAQDNNVAADVLISVAESILNLLQGNPELFETIRIGVDFVALDSAAAAGDVDDAWDATELALQHPVLHRLEIVEGVNIAAGVVLGAVEGVTENFAGGRFRGQFRNHAGRERFRELQSVDDLLSRLFEVVAVLELAAQVRQAEQRLGAQILQVRHAGQGDFQRHGDQTLHLVSRCARILGDHLDNCRGWVGVRFNVDMDKRVGAESQKRQGQHDDDQPVADGPLDEHADHLFVSKLYL